MNQKINLKEIERKSYTSYHQDGVIDITLAFVTLIFSAIVISDMPWLGGIVGILAVSMYAGMKRVLTVPRIGYVKFPQQRAQRITAVTVVLGVLSFVMGIVAFTQTVDQGTPAWLEMLIENHMLTLGGILTGLFLLGAFAFRTKRIYVYALFAFVMSFVWHILSWDVSYYLVVLGGVLLASGLLLMFSFVRKYPVVSRTAEA